RLEETSGGKIPFRGPEAPMCAEGNIQEIEIQQKLGFNAELSEEKGVVEGDFAEVIVAAGSAAVTGAHIDFEEERISVTFESAEFGDVFGGFPVHDLTVVEAG